MRDEMEQLGVLLAKPEPTPEVVAEGRLRLQAAVARRRRRWRMPALGGVALAAAATALVLFVTSGTGVLKPRPGDPEPSTGADQSVRRALLAAANSAENVKPTTGLYWHLRISGPDRSGHHEASDMWTARDGRQWIAYRRPFTNGPARVEPLISQHRGFQLGYVTLSFGQLQALPTDARALVAWVGLNVDRLRPSAALSGPSQLPTPPWNRDQMIIRSLTMLVDWVPAPPKVRAAAFRALADRPGITSLGAVQGGVALLMPADGGGTRLRLVVDPATSLVRSSGDVQPDGRVVLERTYELAEWTDVLPKTVPD